MLNYKDKYVKYKIKYLELKNEIKNKQIGGSKNSLENKLIIHISGASGSGKTTLGNKLIDKFGNKIVVMDIDNLRYQFIISYYGKKEKKIKWNPEAYQNYIDKFIEGQMKPIVFVGLNHMPWWNKKLYYNMHSQYNFYIKLGSNEIFKQKCNRFLSGVFVEQNDKTIMDIIKDETKTIKNLQMGLKYDCGYKQIIKEIEMWNHDYKIQGYKFMDRDRIFESVCKILETNL